LPLGGGAMPSFFEYLSVPKEEVKMKLKIKKIKKGWDGKIWG